MYIKILFKVVFQSTINIIVAYLVNNQKLFMNWFINFVYIVLTCICLYTDCFMSHPFPLIKPVCFFINQTINHDFC